MNSDVICSLNLQLPDSDKNVKYISINSSGTLSEFSASGSVLSSLDIGQCLTACELKVFLSCMPKYIHYLVWSGRTLVVVRKVNSELKVLERLSAVAKVRVCDYFALGFPQAVIWFEDNKQPRVTDFSTSHIKKDFVLSPPETTHSLTKALISQYQSIQSQIKVANKVLAEKKRLTLVTLSDYVVNLRGESQREEINVVPVVEGSKPISSTHTDIILIETPWLRIYNRQYVIGFDVKSLHPQPITGFQYILLNQENLMTETYLYVENMCIKYRDTYTNYDQVSALEGSKGCTVVAVISEPPFTTSTVELSGILCFYLENEEKLRQGYTQAVSVNFRDVISGQFNIKNLNGKEDRLAVLAVSKSLNLEVAGARLDWDYILQTKLSFTCLDSHYYSIKLCNMFTVVQLTDHNCLKIHYQEFQQFLILFHLLKEHVEDNTLQLQNSESINTVVHSLKKELIFLKNAFKEKVPQPSKPLRDTLSISVEPEEWKSIQQKYSRLQAETDFKMYSLISLDK